MIHGTVGKSRPIEPAAGDFRVAHRTKAGQASGTAAEYRAQAQHHTGSPARSEANGSFSQPSCRLPSIGSLRKLLGVRSPPSRNRHVSTQGPYT
ncbi:hypothetical protein NDU88_000167 [Pleurodeles waltl]|uniref:Uncharacterized protein n=1 Tax=Pleurodeles waltl TaxID=8319 RepID=A0AAV7L9E2_PLEWA|nr:hypothetical protein NDU88_000167 [Pleurodeles waltl]